MTTNRRAQSARPAKTYSSADAARILGVTDRTIRRWCDQRLLLHRRTPGGRIWFTQADLDEALEQQLQQRVEPIDTDALDTPNPLLDPTLSVVVPIRHRRRAG